MTRYLLDSNALADCIFRRRGVDDRVRSARATGHKIGTCIPVFGELAAGIEYSATRDRNRDILYRNIVLFRLWPFDFDAAREFARLYAELRRAGRTIQTVDLMPAGVAFALGNCTVVSSDTDFDGIPGLNVENWATP